MLRCASSFVTAAYAKHAAFLMILAPCLQPFYEAVRKSTLFTIFYEFINNARQRLPSVIGVDD